MTLDRAESIAVLVVSGLTVVGAVATLARAVVAGVRKAAREEVAPAIEGIRKDFQSMGPAVDRLATEFASWREELKSELRELREAKGRHGTRLAVIETKLGIHHQTPPSSQEP
jgi:predicted RNase H-like nuclease (RuvC/YqgF family)